MDTTPLSQRLRNRPFHVHLMQANMGLDPTRSLVPFRSGIEADLEKRSESGMAVCSAKCTR